MVLSVRSTQLVSSIGAGVGGALCMLIPMFVYDKNDNLLGERFIWIGIIMGIIAFGAYTLCLKFTNERVEVKQRTKATIFTKHSQRFLLKASLRQFPI